MSSAPRAQDFENVRSQLRIIDRVYERLQARSQGIGDLEGAASCARRRRLVSEMVEWLAASEELGEFVHAGAPSHLDGVYAGPVIT